MIVFTSIKSKNFFSIGSTPIEIILNKDKTTLISGANGSGKCHFPSTKLKLKMSDKIYNEFKDFIDKS